MIMGKKTKLFLVNSVILLTVIVSTSDIYCQNTKQDVVAGIPVNYDESLSGTYTLPDPLAFPDGKKVKNAQQWYKKRRPQIVSLFEDYQYGKVPPSPKDLSFNVFDKATPALNGTAIRKQVTVYFTKDTSDFKMDILIYIPASAMKPVPLFFNVSFSPNANIADDPGIKGGYMRDKEGKKIPVQRKSGFGRMDINQFISQGFGFATVCYGEIEPDFAEGIKYGIRGHYLKEGQEYPAPDEWGAISAWSWGLSRAMDYFETDPQIDSKKVALFGVSRLGKTVLWTGARDTRFGMVIASCSGEGGAALSRRLYGETIDHMTHPTRFFYQFAGNWRNFKDDPSKSPVDAHMLISLMAPRPLLLQTGDTDQWSDPKGEFLAAVAAAPVYELLGKRSLETDTYPAPGVPILNDLGYFMHSGGHGALPADYKIFIEFMKMHF
jgi:(4-O-methyl)-D-glucuronate---lignin esterase